MTSQRFTTDPPRRHRLSRLLAPVAVLGFTGALALAAFSSGPAPAAAVTLTARPGGAVVQVTEQDAGTPVTVPTGDTVQLVLHSTYWTPPRSSDPAHLRPLGAPGTAPSAGTGCHPGTGCGTVTADFLALTPGTCRLTTTRTSCGEALACIPEAANLTVTIVVAPTR
ncbi:hypothetical protein ACIGXM_09640 [Kitasatospora sp. NPDC052896]|uniref:hypothetical protein n=1 Tax=Kitasatospora sp. NPDC052896 TaxID=3364061 RepID=UPI0037CA0AB5